MFRPLEGTPAVELVDIKVDGATVRVAKGRTLAIALLEAGYPATRRNHRAEPRAPYCLMGVCFECLVHLDGKSNVQACLVRAEAGMRVCLPQGGAALIGDS